MSNAMAELTKYQETLVRIGGTSEAAKVTFQDEKARWEKHQKAKAEANKPKIFKLKLIEC